MGTDLQVMKKHFDIIRSQGYDIVPEINKAEYQVMICFDDGWGGIYEYKDEFVKSQIFPTIFIAVDLIGSKGYLTVSQIKEMESLGFRFQAHTWSHQDLTTFDDKGLEHELKESKDWLERKFGHPFNAICFPMGRYSSLVKIKSAEYGYKQMFTSIPGGYYDMKTEDLICRNCAQNVTLKEFKWMLSGTSSIFKHKLMKQHFEK